MAKAKTFLRLFGPSVSQLSPRPGLFHDLSSPSFKYDTKFSYIVAAESTVLTKSQLEACRKVVTRIVRRAKPRAKWTIHPLFHTAVTAKAKGSRMGKGKGDVSKYICMFRKNAIMFKFKNVQKSVLKHLSIKLALKLPIKLNYFFGTECLYTLYSKV